MLALGLQQHVKESTHNLGNILDHVYSESLSNIQVLNMKYMDFISDHKTIIGHINLSREPVINTFKSTRMLHKMDMDKFFEEANLDSLLNNEHDTDLDALQENFEHNITNALDSVAPERIVKNRSKRSKMWFNSDITDKKKEIRRREKVWYKHKCSIF